MAAVRVLLFVCVLYLMAIRGEATVLCETGFCRTYGFDTGCAAPAQDCRINNATHSGMWMPSPTPCNCCEFCLPFYGENQHCSLGGAGLGSTVGRCGSGLTCVADDDGFSYCRRMESECHSAQDDYDSRFEAGQVGALESRPLCNEKANYGHYYCVPTQTCFCQSDAGERVFGEVLNMGASTEQNMHCGCSILHSKIRKSITPGVPHPVTGPRCTSAGNFNPVQCVGRTCYCVDSATGAIATGETVNLDEKPLTELPCLTGPRCTSAGNFYPVQCVGRTCYCVDSATGAIATGETVNLDEKPLTELPCYDASLDLFPSLSEGNPPYNYTTPCFEDMREKIEYLLQSEQDGFNVDFFSDIPECLPDGTYGRIGRSRNGTRICVNQNGAQIDDYEADPNTQQYQDMDCKCAETALLMQSSVERPVCCQNGNFRRIQCRRGVCRCVDSDGRQQGTEAADVTSLSCHRENWRDLSAVDCYSTQ